VNRYAKNGTRPVVLCSILAVKNIEPAPRPSPFYRLEPANQAGKKPQSKGSFDGICAGWTPSVAMGRRGKAAGPLCRLLHSKGFIKRGLWLLMASGLGRRPEGDKKREGPKRAKASRDERYRVHAFSWRDSSDPEREPRFGGE
jgi:hypothetical protein